MRQFLARARSRKGPLQFVVRAPSSLSLKSTLAAQLRISCSSINIGDQTKSNRGISLVVLACKEALTCTSAWTKSASAGDRARPSWVISPPTAITLLLKKLPYPAPCEGWERHAGERLDILARHRSRACSRGQVPCHVAMQRMLSDRMQPRKSSQHTVDRRRAMSWLTDVYVPKPVEYRRLGHLREKPFLGRLPLLRPNENDHASNLC